jgi:hypothetical protein
MALGPRNYLEAKNLENLIYDQLSTTRDTFPQAYEDTLHILNSRLIHQSADIAFTEGKATLCQSRF